MSRAQLSILLLVFLASVILLVIIFALKNGKLPQSLNPAGEYYVKQGQKIGVGYLVENEKSFSVFVKINKIEKNKDKVIAKTDKFDIIIFDKSLSPLFGLYTSNDINARVDRHIIRDTKEAYDESKILEGKLAEVLFRTQPPPASTSVIDCNRKLLGYFKQQGGSLDCTPFGNQVGVYGK